MIELVGLRKVCLMVHDLAEELGFYRDILGLKVADTAEETPCAELEAGAFRLRLERGSAAPLTGARARLVFAVREIETARQELLSRGVPLGPLVTGEGGQRYCEGSDPEGNPFTLEEAGFPVTTTYSTGSNVPRPTGRRVWAV
ncbi:MAG TPA: VOC family protein [Anaerolinea thermolimosa]|uniref:Lactoylglutathione lyase n=1 Tax=Anaerolinea thermolimosa TaxID=229919 RepID=A0A0M9U2L5_9CHLR|nr:VOC family protein [Anaerolinea thermolimosa]GAP08712.1 lactoylglutathione lyase [Anaerolinea thermolimosa]GAP08747.1 lactoylglutathione lyase [Anaerolinea thermolimosa]HCE16457.1 VOC family protein [Anaerolinea thermolimosa]